nr:MAG: replication initiator protein [Microvirus sp.]
MFEAQTHKETSFITLTYAPEHLPHPPSLDYSHFQLFMKRLRKRMGPMRFFMCGEYGDQLSRPHFHAIIFGTRFPDRVLWSRSGSGNDLYRSATLEQLWPFGHSSVADVTFESAAYVARYSLKKVTGDLAEQHYRFVDADTGEVTQRTPEFCHMSLKPGIGGRWFELYSSDVYNGHDYVVINGHKCKPPRYFDRLLKRQDPMAFDDVKTAREFKGYSRRDDSTDSRLAARETVQLAALNRLAPRGDL